MKHHGRIAELAREELLKLNETIDLAQRHRLIDSIELNPQTPWSCIYGLMTGSCYSKEAIILMNQCSSGIILFPSDDNPKIITNFLPGKKKRLEEEGLNGYDRHESFTPLEVAIMIAPEQDVKTMVCFLKGKISELPKFDQATWDIDFGVQRGISITDCQE